MYVKESVITESCDHSLLIVIELVLDEQNLSRPLFPNLLREPLLFRLIRKWILSAFGTKSKINKAKEESGDLLKAR